MFRRVHFTLPPATAIPRLSCTSLPIRSVLIASLVSDTVFFGHVTRSSRRLHICHIHFPLLCLHDWPRFRAMDRCRSRHHRLILTTTDVVKNPYRLSVWLRIGLETRWDTLKVLTTFTRLTFPKRSNHKVIIESKTFVVFFSLYETCPQTIRIVHE